MNIGESFSPNWNRLCLDEGEDRTASPNSAASSFQMEFGLYGGGGNISCQREQMENGVIESERASSRASDEDENGSTRKKLRLSKEQSAFLEESFKEHNTLNPVSINFKIKSSDWFHWTLIRIWFLWFRFWIDCRNRNLHSLSNWISVLAKWKFGSKTEEPGSLGHDNQTRWEKNSVIN